MKFFAVVYLVITLFISVPLFAGILNSKVVYNSDERKEILEESPHEMTQFIQKRTLAMVHASKVFSQPSGAILFMDRHYGRTFKLCKNERFYDQPSLPICTASVIGKDLALTAGHCITENTCGYFRFIADYVSADGIKPIGTVPEKIYHCKKVLFHSETDTLDVAIVQLDREFPYSPLKVSEEPLTTSDQILAVGFPAGLPMKSSGLGPIRKITENVVTAELDTYGGNSGSPIFKKDSDQIQGILVAGEDDFVLSDNKQCFKTKVCDSSSCIGEDIISAKAIQKILTDLF